jgi:hypothetical protein
MQANITEPAQPHRRVAARTANPNGASLHQNQPPHVSLRRGLPIASKTPCRATQNKGVSDASHSYLIEDQKCGSAGPRIPREDSYSAVLAHGPTFLASRAQSAASRMVSPRWNKLMLWQSYGLRCSFAVWRAGPNWIGGETR